MAFQGQERSSPTSPSFVDLDVSFQRQNIELDSSDTCHHVPNFYHLVGGAKWERTRTGYYYYQLNFFIYFTSRPVSPPSSPSAPSPIPLPAPSTPHLSSLCLERGRPPLGVNKAWYSKLKQDQAPPLGLGLVNKRQGTHSVSLCSVEIAVRNQSSVAFQ